ncbi:uncharacterized protein B0I36DRAFT_245730 [Microdochium trichocladiopsis]|uniref:3-beta hydroxysteroid dehydrogenase/isomerase domain-containing protein n=1 Tax=Microdochium trichocladiopsis TaxID=1682393 RepID=A0A9P9BLZ1_9PEZI|nr:uncharacterized protein B0I36DRAFT_245730 [Microdochium trichocladiopsis]KAH7029093.1 hypothetical protein B0I36DRAFT_245730 [Microdochium trichocladiopsis]
MAAPEFPAALKDASPAQLILGTLASLTVLVALYLWRINTLLSRTPPAALKLAGPRWTPELLHETYARLERDPPGLYDAKKLPPRLDRRYVVTGGSGLVGGYIVLQLLARGTPPSAIRILDIRRTERSDMLSPGSPAREVEFVETDITSPVSVEAAFSRPWAEAVAHLPMTVFHTAAVILASERSEREYWFPEAVNVRGTRNLLAAARKHGAGIFSATSSASISIRPVQPWVAPWAGEPRNFFQLLDLADSEKPLRHRTGYFANYPASKAVAERMVCDENEDSFRTGSIRPANGVYGNPTDNMLGAYFFKDVVETWVPHMVQSFVHGANVAVAHLAQEAVLAKTAPESRRYAGRPYVVTDPNPPIMNRDMYPAIRTLLPRPWRTMELPPVVPLLMAHGIELWSDLPHRFPLLKKLMPPITGEAKHLKPGIFSITTHLVAADEDTRKPVSEGGLGYTGVVTTLDGLVYEILEWNREVAAGDAEKKKITYTSSLTLGERLQKTGLSIVEAVAQPLSTKTK